jgi:hypothetical protein
MSVGQRFSSGSHWHALAHRQYPEGFMPESFRRADTFRGDSAITTWLDRIVAKAAPGILRSSPRVAEPAGEPATGAQTGQADTRIDLRKQWSGISREHQAALLLMDMMGYPIVEAAEILGVSAGNTQEPRGSRSGCLDGEAGAHDVPRVERMSAHCAARTLQAEAGPEPGPASACFKRSAIQSAASCRSPSLRRPLERWSGRERTRPVSRLPGSGTYRAGPFRGRRSARARS